MSKKKFNSSKKNHSSGRRQKAKKLIAGAGLASTLLLSSGSQANKALSDKPPALRLPSGLVTTQEVKKLLVNILSRILPKSQRVLTQQEEDELAQAVTKVLGVKASTELEGNRLNHVIGRIGLEQHIPRYPGDTVADRNFPEAGITPSTAAWGYFAPSRTRLTAEHRQMEKYYVAVQTLYLKDWQKRFRTLREWYKYRKVLVINPETGSAVVAVIADAGPAKWTGKQFGGSPQVMHNLGLYPKKTSATIVLLFLDDPDNNIPLGPIDYPLPDKPPQTV